ncbi:hypothetical protein S7711_01554 [Stachybotrys chartarum IBT 7711]|uniref:Uncharacterized protein n=1 Tax=Stachybotrys chartarum (strain CBS 109288 / IBT 7711) TaxID=1280523 RepID=A0A084BC16_STACB|nr:hypothetical protein S7711_01554 [Stachybotrys chartarum IBT 7711]
MVSSAIAPAQPTEVTCHTPKLCKNYTLIHGPDGLGGLFLASVKAGHCSQQPPQKLHCIDGTSPSNYVWLGGYIGTKQVVVRRSSDVPALTNEIVIHENVYRCLQKWWKRLPDLNLVTNGRSQACVPVRVPQPYVFAQPCAGIVPPLEGAYMMERTPYPRDNRLRDIIMHRVPDEHRFDVVPLKYLHGESPWDLVSLAGAMGFALAIMHGAAQLDADGVDFHLATHPKPALWLSGFGKCWKFACAGEDVVLLLLVKTVATNPTWPRPPTAECFQDASESMKPVTAKVWTVFRQFYLAGRRQIARGRPELGMPSGNSFITDGSVVGYGGATASAYRGEPAGFCHVSTC